LSLLIDGNEDHDFEEINYLTWKEIPLEQRKFRPGIHSTEGLDEFFEIYKQELGTSTNAEYLKDIFKVLSRT
jgi:hypothetical protein